MHPKREYIFKFNALYKGDETYDVVWDGTEDVPAAMIVDTVKVDEADDRINAVPAILTYLIEVAENSLIHNKISDGICDLACDREDLYLLPNARSKRAASYFHDKLQEKIKKEVALAVKDDYMEHVMVVDEDGNQDFKPSPHRSPFLLNVTFDNERHLVSGIQVQYHRDSEDEENKWFMSPEYAYLKEGEEDDNEED